MQAAQPVIGVAVVSGPADQYHVVFAILGALEVLAPFVADDLHFQANPGPVGLEHFGHELGIGVIRALHGHGIERDLGAVLDAGLLEQGLGFFRVVGRILDGLVIGPLGWRHAVDCNLPRVLVDRLDDFGFVHRHVQSLTNRQLVEGRALYVVGDEAQVETRFFDHAQVGVLLERGDIGRAQVEGDLAFVLLELLQAYRRVGVDRVDQLVDLDLVRLPIFLVCRIADLGIFLVTLKAERPGADGLVVDVAGLARRQQVLGVFCRKDRGEAHGQVLDERGVSCLEGEDHRHGPGFLDLGDVVVKAHANKIGELGGVGLAEGVLPVEHAVEGEQYVVRVEIPCGRERFVGMKLHALAQVKAVLQAVVRNVPASGQGRDSRRTTFFELYQPVVQRFGSVVIGGAGVLGGIESRWAAFGAEHQAFGSLGLRSQGQQTQAQHGCYGVGKTHDGPYYFMKLRSQPS
ncbi:hypothetical protein D9M71_320560 [compost metagenome]